ncbi:MAG: GNAT family N-acetyltransferase [Planctomycetota bacterium]
MSSALRPAARAWEGHAGLAEAAEDWTAVLAASGADPFFHSPLWALAYAEAFVPAADVFGWTLRDEAGLSFAVLPFRREPARGRFALRRAILLLDGSFDGEYLDLVVRRGREEEAAAAALDLLAARNDIEAVVLSGVPGTSPTLPALRAVLRHRRLPWRERAVPAGTAPLPATFAAFLATLKPRMRSKVRSEEHRAQELGAELAWCEDPAALPRDLENLYELHRRRWEAAGRPGSFADPRRRRLYDMLMPRLLAAGRLRFSRLALAGTPAAYQLGAVAGGTYYQLQEGYDPAGTDLRAGIALRAWSIARLIEEGVTRYDFLGGLDRHKTDWGAVLRPTTTIAFALPRWRARIAYGLRAWLDARRSAAPE